MRFLMQIMLPAGNDYEKGAMPSAELVAEMTKYNEDLVRAGVMISGDGLHPTSRGVRISSEGGRRLVTDGPFAESREVLGGFWMIRVGSKEEAIEWAKRIPDHDAIVELRQVFDMEDFPQDVQDAARSPILREHLEKQGSA